MAIHVTTTKRDIHWVKMLCYGSSGVGKTMLSATAPKPVIISAERGLLSLARQDVPVIEVRNLDEAREAYRYVFKSNEFLTVCLDSISELAERILANNKKNTKDGRKAYGDMNDEVAELIRDYRDIPDKHVYMISKEVRFIDEVTGKVNYEPLMPGKTLKNNLPYFYDIVACMRIGKTPEKKEFRYLQTQPSVQYMAKDRSGLLEAMEKPDLTKLFNKITGAK